MFIYFIYQCSFGKSAIECVQNKTALFAKNYYTYVCIICCDETCSFE